MDFFRVSIKTAVYNIPSWFYFFPLPKSPGRNVTAAPHALTLRLEDQARVNCKLRINEQVSKHNKALHPSAYFAHFLTSVTEV